ncbi:MAG: hypothetical protein ACI4J7_13310 [Ruminiclostridium sp.]
MNKNENTREKCSIRCNTKGSAGVTKVIISQDNYDKICFISSITRKTMQEITAELLSYALKNLEICSDNGTPLNIKI